MNKNCNLFLTFSFWGSRGGLELLQVNNLIFRLRTFGWVRVDNTHGWIRSWIVLRWSFINMMSCCAVLSGNLRGPRGDIFPSVSVLRLICGRLRLPPPSHIPHPLPTTHQNHSHSLPLSLYMLRVESSLTLNITPDRTLDDSYKLTRY